MSRAGVWEDSRMVPDADWRKGSGQHSIDTSPGPCTLTRIGGRETFVAGS